MLAFGGVVQSASPQAQRAESPEHLCLDDSVTVALRTLVCDAVLPTRLSPIHQPSLTNWQIDRQTNQTEAKQLMQRLGILGDWHWKCALKRGRPHISCHKDTPM